MNPHNLSIDISGLWSRAQARAVMEALREELAERHLKLEMVDASSMSEPGRVYLMARCACGAIVDPRPRFENCYIYDIGVGGGGGAVAGAAISAAGGHE